MRTKHRRTKHRKTRNKRTRTIYGGGIIKNPGKIGSGVKRGVGAGVNAVRSVF